MIAEHNMRRLHIGWILFVFPNIFSILFSQIDPLTRNTCTLFTNPSLTYSFTKNYVFKPLTLIIYFILFYY